MDSATTTPASTPTWTVGQLVDVISPDQIVYPARILSINVTIRIHYLGWLDQDDEDIVEFERILPFGTYTTPAKAWVRLSSKFCSWPCTLYLLKPLTDIGLSFLKMEKNCIVVPAGPVSGGPLRPYKHGVFMCNNKIKPFEPSARFIAAGRDAKNSKYRACFEEALTELTASDAITMPFQLHGAWNTGFANPFRSATPLQTPAPAAVSVNKKRKASDEMQAAMEGYYSNSSDSINLITDFELDPTNDSVASLYMHIFSDAPLESAEVQGTCFVAANTSRRSRKPKEPKHNNVRKLRQMKVVVASFRNDFDSIVDGVL